MKHTHTHTHNLHTLSECQQRGCRGRCRCEWSVSWSLAAEYLGLVLSLKKLGAVSAADRSSLLAVTDVLYRKLSLTAVKALLVLLPVFLLLASLLPADTGSTPAMMPALLRLIHKASRCCSSPLTSLQRERG